MKTGRTIAVAHKAWNRFGDFVLFAACFLLSLLLYLQTLAPSVATLFDDSLEFPLVAYRLAIAHPTGYPLYTLLAKLFTLGPWHNVAWAVNLLSALMGALTVALVYLIIRDLALRRGAALLGALALAVSPVFWSQAVIAEVYTLNAAFLAALLWLALRWSRQPLRPVEPFSLLLVPPEGRRALFIPGEGLRSRLPLAVRRAGHRIHQIYRRAFPAIAPSRRLRIHPGLYALAAVLGFGLTHHRTILLLVPALFLFLLLVEQRVLSRAALLGPEHPERPRWLQFAGRPVVLLAACLLLPPLLYLYLPLRGNAGSLDGTYANTWSGFWQWVTASGYNVFLAENPLARELDAAFYVQLFWQQFGPVGCALAMVGVIGLLRRPKALVLTGAPALVQGRKALALTGVAFLTYVAFAVGYRVPDVEVFFIPAFLIACVWIGAGLDYALDLLTIRGRAMALRRLLAICLVVLVLAAVLQPLYIAARNYPDQDLSRRWIVHDYGQYLLQEPLPPDSTIVGLLGEMTLLRYFQDTTGLRPDVETIAADGEAARQAAVEAALARGRSVFITRPLPGLAGEQSLGAVTGLIDVGGDYPETLVRAGEPSDQVPDLPQPVDLEPVPGLQLLGYGVREHRGHWRDWARLRLWWRAAEGLKEPLKVSARLADSDGTVVAATDAEPVSGLYPTTAWRPDEVVADAYEIPLPAGLPPGQYVPQVILYEPDTGQERGRVELAPVTLEGNPDRPPRRALEESVAETAYARFGDVELLGYTAPRSGAPGSGGPDAAAVYHTGDSLPLTLLWQAQGEPSGGLSASFWLEGDSEVALGEAPVGGPFPSEQWTGGQVVRQWPALQLPEGTPPGTYRLKMRVARDGQPLPWGRWLLPLGSDLELGSIVVAP